MSLNSYESLNELRLRNIGCNFIIKIGAHVFPTHRVVLMARMKYFWNILTEDTHKAKKSTVVFEPQIIDSTYFNEFLNYVYTSKIDLTMENFRAIHKTAEYFRFDELINEVEEHMKSNMKVENVPHFRTIFKGSSSDSLKKMFKKSFSRNSFACFWQRSVNGLSKKKPNSISSSKYSKNYFELKENDILEMMFHYSADWVLEDKVNRSGMLLELLKNIPLESLSFDFLKRAAYHFELIRKDNECLKLLFDAFITAFKSDVREERRQRIENLYATYVLYVIGGSDETLSSVSEYNSATRKWTATTPMPSKRTHFGCAVIGHKIYVCGGRKGKQAINELTVFDTLTRTWAQLIPMKHARQLCGAAVLNGQIYVAGGMRDDTKDLAVVERYCVATNQWSDVTPMTTMRSRLELVALNGFLYAINGSSNYDLLNSVERYDPQTDQWITMNNTVRSHSALGSAVWNNNIYIVGYSNFEMYSPKNDKWTELPALSKSKFGRRLTVFDDKLYAIGGVSVEDRSLKDYEVSKSVEVYDFQTRVWQPEPDMDIARSDHGVAVVKKSLFVPTNAAIESLNKFRLQNTGCDVILKIGDHEFPVHQKVLTARLEYFRNKLNVHTEKENVSLITLPETIESRFFSEVLNYLYTSKITFTTENIRPIYKTAEYLRFDELIYEVQEHMEFTVNIGNVRSYLPIVIEFGLKSLQGVFTQFVHKQLFSNINRRSREKLISTLSLKYLEKLLRNFKETGSIEDMFHYTVDWISHDEVNRSEMMLGLLKNIPFEKLSPNFLIGVVSQNHLVRNNIECLNLLLNSIIPVSNSHNESREDTLYAIGGSDGDDLSSVSYYNSTTCEWTATTPMPSERTTFGCAVIEDKIYIAGGWNGERSMNELTVFDTHTREWTPLTPMKHARQLCAAVVLDEQIYVAGGKLHNDPDRLAVVERYNVHTDQWEDVAPMTTKRSGPELVALNGFLYAIGGYDGDDVLNSVERYDRQIDQWTPMNNTNNTYVGFGSAVFNGNIYIAGKNKCEVYNAAFKIWTEMPAPSECNYSRRLAVFNRKLYAIGGLVGEWGEHEGSKAVEVYNFLARVWKPEPDMDVARCLHGVAVVKN